MIARIILKWQALLVIAGMVYGPVPVSIGICKEKAPKPGVAAPSEASENVPGDHRKEDLRGFLSRIAPPGWTLFGTVAEFSPEDLWQRINGRATFFLAYDVERMTLAIYAGGPAGDSFVEVSIYDMGTTANAFGVFSAERTEEVVPVDLGRQGCLSGSSFFLWKGRYYVQIIGSEDSPQLLEINRTLGEKIMAVLDDPGEPLWGLDALPGVDRVFGSERYFRKDAMGLDFLEDVFTARYRKQGELITVFLLRKDDPAAAGEILERYAAFAEAFGEETGRIAHNGGVVLWCDMGGSYDALFRIDRTVAGVSGVRNRQLALDSVLEIKEQVKAR